MALIKCPNCGHEISDKAIQCPHCGKEPKKPRRKKKIKHKFLIIGIIILGVIGTFIAYVGFHEIDQTQMTNKDKIEKAAELMGEKVVNNNLNCSPALEKFLKDVSLFGYNGEFGFNMTEEVEDNKINCMIWSTSYKVDEEDVTKIVEGLSKLYGNYYANNIEYMDIKNGYQWQNLENYSWIVCGMNEDKKEIEIYWIK